MYVSGWKDKVQLYLWLLFDFIIILYSHSRECFDFSVILHYI